MKDHNSSPITRQATGVAAKGGEADGGLEAAAKIIRREMQDNSVPAVERSERAAALVAASLDRTLRATQRARRKVERHMRAYAEAGRNDLWLDIEIIAGLEARSAAAEALLREISEDASPNSDAALTTGDCAVSGALVLRTRALLSALSHQPPRAPDEPGDRAREETKS